MQVALRGVEGAVATLLKDATMVTWDDKNSGVDSNNLQVVLTRICSRLRGLDCGT